MIDLIHSAGKEAVFHRAFDCVAQQERAVEALILLGADRILTSGGAPMYGLAERNCKSCKASMVRISHF